MRGLRPAGWMLRPPALAAVLVADALWPLVRDAGARVAGWGPLARLHARIGRLPPGVALPLFLVPEACSRLGWVGAVWFLLHGEPWRAVALYAVTKLVAGSLALWVCSACLPSLLLVPLVARGHAALMAGQARAAAWSARRAGPFRAAMAQVRARRVSRNSAASPAPAIPSARVDPCRTR